MDTQCGAETCKTQCLESTTGLREGGETAPRDAQMSNFLRIPCFECGEVRGQSVYYASILPVAVLRFTILLLIDTSVLDYVGIVVVIVA